MLNLNANQIEAISQIIQDDHYAFIYNNISPSLVPDRVIKDLKARGLIEKTISLSSFPKDSYMFGQVSAAIGHNAAQNMTPAQFEKFIRGKKYIPLTEAEKIMVEYLEKEAASYIKGLGNKVDNQFRTIAIETDKDQRRLFEWIIKKEAVKAKELRLNKKKLASNIGHETKDWSRELLRIADTVTHNAFDHGRAGYLGKRFGPAVRVYKRTQRTACPYCINLHIKDTSTWEPRIFTLSELAGKTNVGKPRSQWTAVIGTVHPYCRCTLERIPEGYEWNAKSGIFVPPKGTGKYSEAVKLTIRRT